MATLFLVYVLNIRQFITSLPHGISLLASSLKCRCFLGSYHWPTPLCSLQAKGTSFALKVLTPTYWSWLPNLIPGSHLSKELKPIHTNICWSSPGYPRGTSILTQSITDLITPPLPVSIKTHSFYITWGISVYRSTTQQTPKIPIKWSWQTPLLSPSTPHINYSQSPSDVKFYRYFEFNFPSSSWAVLSSVSCLI